MPSTLTPEIIDYLRSCGISDRVINECTPDTRMWHDLGLYGDIAESCMSLLAEKYGVNLGGFLFDRFFPQEFVGRGAFTRTIFWLFPFVGSIQRKCEQHSPLTLHMINEAMLSRRWVETADE